MAKLLKSQGNSCKVAFCLVFRDPAGYGSIPAGSKRFI